MNGGGTLAANVAVMAGAGTGKTHHLVSLCLQLFGGAARAGSPLRPSGLVLVTFTEKAAGEMRARVWNRLNGLASGPPGDGDEPELRSAFASLGLPLPAPGFWRGVRDELGSATISTFHSLCVQLLRTAPPGVGVDPSFELLDEQAASVVLENVAERLVIAAVEAGDREVAELCRGLTVSGRGRSAGLVSILCGIYQGLCEEGARFDSLAVGDEVGARADFDSRVGDIAKAVRAAKGFAVGPKGGKYASVLDECACALEGMTPHTFFEPDRFPRAARALSAGPRVPGRESDLKRYFQQVKYGILGNGGQLGLRNYLAAIRGARWEAALKRLLREMRIRHRAELDRRGALDFTELLIRARDLLRDHAGFRGEVQARMGVLLVDEFQDTNGLQADLVRLLAERRTPGPGTYSQDRLGEVPLEPGFLYIVGDRKQSIYEFRGADVSVFEQLANSMVEQGGRSYVLRENWRSCPELLEFFNRVVPRVMATQQPTADYEVEYRPEKDDLLPATSGGTRTVAVERLIFDVQATAPECRAAEAAQIAVRIRKLIGAGSPDQVRERNGTRREVRPADIAVLFRGLSSVELYRTALARAGIPHRVIAGRGYFASLEASDLQAMLSLVADPGDRIALAAVLRSPWVGVSDELLFRLCGGGKDKLSLRLIERTRQLLEPEFPGEVARVGKLLSVLEVLRKEQGRLGVRATLELALTELGYRTKLAASPGGEQAIANVEKVLDLSERSSAALDGGVGGFARELSRLREENAREGPGETDGVDGNGAVSLLTIHGAKGLEWPVVFVADLGFHPPSAVRKVLVDKNLGLGIRPWLEEEPGFRDTPRTLALIAERQRRDRAERARLFYVALTRARDRLVLSGQTKTSKHTWRGDLDAWIGADPGLGALVCDVGPEKFDRSVAQPSLVRSAEVAGDREIDELLWRVRGTPAVLPETSIFSVTHLSDHALCPRRAMFLHEQGLDEPSKRKRSAGVEGRHIDGVARRRRGSLGHAILEKVDLKVVRQNPLGVAEHLDELIRGEGEDPSSPEARSVLPFVRRFLQTGFADRLVAARDGSVWREYPFLAKLGSGTGCGGLFVKGQMDLLFEQEDGSLLIVDYKFSRRPEAGLEPYQFQLDAYALAAQKLAREETAIRCGVAFLEEATPEPEFGAPRLKEENDLFEAQVERDAASLARAFGEPQREGRAVTVCWRIGCGFIERCHPGASAL